MSYHRLSVGNASIWLKVIICVCWVVIMLSNCWHINQINIEVVWHQRAHVPLSRRHVFTFIKIREVLSVDVVVFHTMVWCVLSI